VHVAAVVTTVYNRANKGLVSRGNTSTAPGKQLNWDTSKLGWCWSAAETGGNASRSVVNHNTSVVQHEASADPSYWCPQSLVYRRWQ
jgi:hypothetical protein